ncbi:MAG TPA: ROK family protein [Ktedonobacteraceae bacterium]|jgi:predicted NBD/HSP70 family sugar kinase
MNRRDDYSYAASHGEQARQYGLGVDQEKVRTYNRQLIVTYLREHSPALRVRMARDLGLSRATVSNIVKDLIDERWVYEGEKRQTTTVGGKRATEIAFNGDAGHIVGVDIGRSRLRLYLTNLANRLLDRWVGPFDTALAWEKGLGEITRQIEGLVEAHLGGWETVRGIGIGMPGAPDRRAQLISPPALANWRDVDIPEQVRKLLRLPADFPVYLEKDANLGALGESRYGAGRGIRNMIYVKLSTGIGAGLILNGELFRGEHGLAGEFGHLHIPFDEALSAEHARCPSCGQHGCLEALAGLQAIVRDAGPARFLDEPITSEHMREIVKEAQAGEEQSRTALVRAGKRIGAAIGSALINGYNPALILLDGGSIRPGRDDEVINTLLLAQIQQSAQQTCLPASWSGTRILPGQLGDDAVGLGAIALVIERDPALNMPASA